MKREYLCTLFLLSLAGWIVMVPVSADTGTAAGTITFTKPTTLVSAIGDKITLSGINTESKTTYLCVQIPGGGGLPGVAYNISDSMCRQIQSTDPATHHIIDGDASTFQTVAVGPDNTWSWTWDTQTIADPGDYGIEAFSSPDINENERSGDYAMTERIVHAPENYVTTPSTDYKIDARLLVDYTVEGGICSSNPDSGPQVVVEWETEKGNGTNHGCMAGWELSDPKYIKAHAYEIRGKYPVSLSIVQAPLSYREKTVLTASDPNGGKSLDLYLDLTKPAVSDTPAKSAAKNPFSGLMVSPSPARKGDRVFINGTVQGNPGPGIALWIFGYQNREHPIYAKRVTVLPGQDGRFSYELDSATTGAMPEGILYVVAQDPGKNGAFDVVLAGNALMNLQRPDYYEPSKNQQVMRIDLPDLIGGPSPMHGRDAESATLALLGAIDDVKVDDIAIQTYFMINGTVSPHDLAATPEDPVTTPVTQPETSVTQAGIRKVITPWPTDSPRKSPVGIAEIVGISALAGFVFRKRQ
jgi:hypothetical protein